MTASEIDNNLSTGYSLNRWEHLLGAPTLLVCAYKKIILITLFVLGLLLFELLLVFIKILSIHWSGDLKLLFPICVP